MLTAAAARKTGPVMMFSFMIAGFVCAVAALCYSELASMVAVSGSAYTYAVMGELLAWMVGQALILEHAVAASAVCVGWSGYVMGLIHSMTGLRSPDFLSSGLAWGLDQSADSKNQHSDPEFLIVRGVSPKTGSTFRHAALSGFGPRVDFSHGVINLPAILVAGAGDLAPGSRYA